MGINLLTSLEAVHDWHVKVQQNEIYLLIWILLYELEYFQTIASLFKYLNI
jgi:hypothetical protein